MLYIFCYIVYYVFFLNIFFSRKKSQAKILSGRFSPPLAAPYLFIIKKPCGLGCNQKNGKCVFWPKMRTGKKRSFLSPQFGPLTQNKLIANVSGNNGVFLKMHILTTKIRYFLQGIF